MNETLEYAARIALASYADWARGGGGKWTRKVLPFVSHKHFWLVVLALNYTSIIGFSWWALIFILWMAVCGVAMGTGDPLGKIVKGHSNHHNDNNQLGSWEKWQYLFKTDNAFTNHGILGGIWSFGAVVIVTLQLLTAIAQYFLGGITITIQWEWLIVFASHLLGFYIASYLGRLFPKSDIWERVEQMRSGLAILIFLLVSNFVI